MLLRFLEGARRVRGVAGELFGVELLDRPVVLVADVDEGVDHRREQLGPRRHLLVAERRRKAQLRGAGGHLFEQLTDPARVHPLVPFVAVTDPDHAEGQVRSRREEVRNEVDPTGLDAGLVRGPDVEPLRGVVPPVRHEHEVPLDASGAHAEEVGSDGERIPDRRATARLQERDEVLDVGEVLLVDLSEGDGSAHHLREGDQSEQRSGVGGVLQDAEDRGPGDLHLLVLPLIGPRLREGGEHALGEVEHEYVSLPGGSDRGPAAAIFHTEKDSDTGRTRTSSGTSPNDSAEMHTPITEGGVFVASARMTSASRVLSVIPGRRWKAAREPSGTCGSTPRAIFINRSEWERPHG